MGFIREIYSGNRAGLVVSFSQAETSKNFLLEIVLKRQ